MGRMIAVKVTHMTYILLPLYQLSYLARIAGDGFEPPFSRIWALRDSASLSCDVHVWKNHFSTFTYWLLEEVTLPPINSTHSELGYTFLRTALCFSYHQTFSLQTMGKIGIEPIMFTTRERFYRPPQHRQSLPLSHNPDSRVSNRFIVLCFPLSSFLYLRYAYWQPGGFLITVVCSTSIFMSF